MTLSQIRQTQKSFHRLIVQKLILKDLVLYYVEEGEALEELLELTLKKTEKTAATTVLLVGEVVVEKLCMESSTLLIQTELNEKTIIIVL
jgi:hypothetical protein